MSRLYLFAEGPTEQTWAGSTLNEHLLRRDIQVHPVLIANARKRQHVHRGGIRKYVQMKNDIVRFLTQNPGRDVYFTTMIDLYGLPGDFPGRAESEMHRPRPYDRVAELEQAFSADIADPRFIPYVQLHEFEALLFVDPEQFRGLLNCGDGPLQNLAAIAQQTEPELINDNFETAPSRRIIGQIPEYAAAKSTAGPLIAEAIGLQRLRAACPHFNDWLTRLETLG
ncbi:MAG: DUF4276 family protein [Bacteroidia bacterium]|nr:DUF4276 family protein [Bacteroidia bacterium]